MGLSVEGIAALLQNCGNQKNLTECMRVYARSVERGLNLHGFLGGHFIRTFAACGSLMEASKHFLRLLEHNVFTCSAIISAHVNSGLGKEAMQLYKYMLQLSIEPDNHVFVAILKACCHSHSPVHGMLLHSHIVESSMETDCHIGNTLVNMYGRSSCVGDACAVFAGLPKKDLVTWNAIISGLSQNGQFLQAFQLLLQMEGKGIEPDRFTFASALRACTSKESRDTGNLIHVWVIEKGFDANTYICSCLIDMYVNCDSIEDARGVFDGVSRRDVVIWNTMMVGYIVHGLWEPAFLVYTRMQEVNVLPDKTTCVNALRIISKTLDFEEGRLIHMYAVEKACNLDLFVVNGLIDMYAKCSSLLDACAVFHGSPRADVVTWSALVAGHFGHGLTKEALHLFDIMQGKGVEPNVVTWTVIIAGCAENNLSESALVYFTKMLEEGAVPNSATYVALLKVCKNLMDLQQGKAFHAWIIENGDETDVYISNALIDMYGKYGDLEEARYVFATLSKPDTISWNTMIEVFSEHGYGEEAIEHFHQMQQDGWKPDSVTILSVLKACAVSLALQEGMRAHNTVIVDACEPKSWVDNSLIDMYSRCGNLYDALKIFRGASKERTETWNALMCGLGVNLKYDRGIYAEMVRHGAKPDAISFICLMSACSQLGLITEGYNHFVSMKEVWSVEPAVDHYGCMVDLWGRAGCLDEARQVLVTMPSRCDKAGWMSLLHHAQVYGKFDLAEECMEQVKAVGTLNDVTSGHTVMSRFFSDIGMHGVADNQQVIYSLRTQAKACIEVEGKVHSFLVRDYTHAACEDIYAKLRTLVSPLSEGGFVPRHDLVKLVLGGEFSSNSAPHLGELEFGPISYKEEQCFGVYGRVEVSSNGFCSQDV